MRTYKALVTYSERDGEPISGQGRHKVSVSYTKGEPHPKDRVIAIEWSEGGGVGRGIFLSLKMIEAATGLKFRRH